MNSHYNRNMYLGIALPTTTSRVVVTRRRGRHAIGQPLLTDSLGHTSLVPQTSCWVRVWSHFQEHLVCPGWCAVIALILVFCGVLWGSTTCKRRFFWQLVVVVANLRNVITARNRGIILSRALPILQMVINVQVSATCWYLLCCSTRALICRSSIGVGEVADPG